MIARNLGATILRFYCSKDEVVVDDDWSYRSCKAAVKSSPPTNQHSAFYRPYALPVAQPTTVEY